MSQLCIDPMQGQMFLMMVGMIKGFTMGAPMFGTPNDFIKTMKGQGQLGPMLTAMGLKPVQFLSDSEMAKMLTTESKVFSIYADGVVPGYRRETRVRVHTVVDFRNSPPPGMAPAYGASPMGSGTGPGGTFGASAPMPNNPAGASTQFGAAPMTGSGSGADAITGALVPNPGGSIVYFRIL
jgi:general secretion pathway protein K